MSQLYLSLGVMILLTIMTTTLYAATIEVEGYRPDMNAIPELYPEKYPGLTAKQAPHGVPIPTHFSWCQSHICSPNLQQHITYTPLCFLHASLHMLNDRINYAIEKAKLGLPGVYLSRQDYLDFSHLHGYGQNPLEEGGEGVDVMEWARQFGIPDETCNPWQSDGKNHQNKDESQRCRNCMMLYNDQDQHCWNIENYVKYRVESYNFVRGEKEMMNEIYQNGPIQCGAVVDDEMIYNYAGGIYNDFGRLENAAVDHDLTIYGWGEVEQEDGTIEPYWLVRNSWGSNIWGSNGMFLVHRGNNTMRLEERCLFANVDISELIDHMAGKNVGTMFGLINPAAGDKPRLFPPNWEKLPHNYGPADAADKELAEQRKLDSWFEKNLYTKLSDQRRDEANQDIIIGAPKSTSTSIFEWVFSITGIVTIGIILAVFSAGWLYWSSTSQSDGYQPIPQLP
jgi:hypothetical protein